MTHALEGNGVHLVRERALATRVQAALEQLYLLERVADVGEFLHAASDGEREALIVSEKDDGHIEIALRVPILEAPEAALDTLCQIIEGVSHFVYLTDRVRALRQTTELELEVQAEVDKYVVLAASIAEFDVQKSRALAERLFERVHFCHQSETERGTRYRVANSTARAFVRNLEQRYLREGRITAMRQALRKFYALGQEEKLRAGRG